MKDEIPWPAPDLRGSKVLLSSRKSGRHVNVTGVYERRRGLARPHERYSLQGGRFDK